MSDNPSGISRRKALKSMGAAGIGMAAMSGVGSGMVTMPGGGSSAADNAINIYLHETYSPAQEYDHSDFNEVKTAIENALQDYNSYYGHLQIDNFNVIEGDAYAANKPYADTEDDVKAFLRADRDHSGESFVKNGTLYEDRQQPNDVHLIVIGAKWGGTRREFPDTAIGMGRVRGHIGDTDQSPSGYINVDGVKNNASEVRIDNPWRSAKSIAVHETAHAFIDPGINDNNDSNLTLDLESPGGEHACGGVDVDSGFITKVYPLSAGYCQDYSLDSLFKKSGRADIPHEFWDGEDNGPISDYMYHPNVKHGLLYNCPQKQGDGAATAPYDSTMEAMNKTINSYFDDY